MDKPSPGPRSQRRRAPALAEGEGGAWSPPEDDATGYATKIGGSIIDQFVLGHDPTDVLRELVQNEFDADGNVMSVTFGTEQLSISGSGKPINKKGWQRLDVVIGTGRVAGDSTGAKIEPKENGIGSKNFGLRSLFLFGDRIFVRSSGRRAVQNLARLATKLERDPESKGQRGVSIHVPYRTEAFDRLQPFTPEREIETFDKMASGLLATMVKLALPGRKRGIRALTLRSDGQGRTLAWRQDVTREPCKVTGVSAFRRVGRLTDRIDAGAKPVTRRFEEIEFTRAVAVPAGFADQPLGPYYPAGDGLVRIGVSLPVRLKRPDISLPGRFFYPLQTPSSATGSAVSVSAPFDLVSDRSALLTCEWNSWLMSQAAELVVALLTEDWIARFGSDAFLAIRDLTEAKPPAFSAALKKHLEEAACWPTAAGGLAKATEIVIPEDPSFVGLVEASRYLRPDLADVPELGALARQCGAKPFTRNSMIRLRCAPKNEAGLATKVATGDANYHFTDYTADLADVTRQRAMAQAIAAVGRRLSNENRRDLKSTKSTLAADGSLQAADDLVVVDDDIWSVSQAPLATRLHRSLIGEKALTDLCTPFDLDRWVRAAAGRASGGTIGGDEREALYKHLLSGELTLSRPIVTALRQAPVLRDHRGGWAAPVEMVILPTAQAQLLSKTIHAPAPALLKRPKLLAALRLGDKLTGEHLVTFAEHLADEPDKAAAFEALLKANPQLLIPGTVRRLRPIPFLAARSGELAAPADLFVDNEVNRICAANDSRIVAGRNHGLYVRLGCQERPSVPVMLKALEELKDLNQPPADIATFYAAFVQALRAEKATVGNLADRPILWHRDGYSAPSEVLVGARVPAWFQKAAPLVRGPPTLVESFEVLGASTTPLDRHWIKLFTWVAGQTTNSRVGPELRQLLHDAYHQRGYSGLPDKLPEDTACLLGQDGRLFSRANARAGRFVEDDFPTLAVALRQAAATTGFAAITDDTRHFFSALSLRRLTSIAGAPKLAVGLESKPPPWFKEGHSNRILALLRREDFRAAVDLLVYDFWRAQEGVRPLRQREVMDRLAAIEQIRFVTGIDRQYALDGKTAAITTEAAAVGGDIALKPTRTKFEFEQNLTYALAELLGAAKVSDARRLSVTLLPLLMCETSADMSAYLERQGLTAPTWVDTAMPVADPEADLEPPPSPQKTLVHSLLTEMFDQAKAAGPDPAPPAPSTPAPAPMEHSARVARRPFTLPEMSTVAPSIKPASEHALVARPKPQPGGGWYSGGGGSWRPPEAYDVDRDQKVGGRGEEIVYFAELERVRALGYDKPADHVTWVSKSQPGADHDIRSIDKDGEPLWLEVKSTMGIDGRFDWPQREFEKALRERGRYVLWRVYEAHTTHPVAKAFIDPAGLLERSQLRVELSGMVGFVEPK